MSWLIQAYKSPFPINVWTPQGWRIKEGLPAEARLVFPDYQKAADQRKALEARFPGWQITLYDLDTYGY